MDDANISIRRATPGDQRVIRALVHSERLNPTGLKWSNFMVAADRHDIVGAIQMRRHSDGSRELGSLVVARGLRGRGLAGRMIDALLAGERGPVWMITADAIAGTFERWGFHPIDPRSAPVKVRRNYRMGNLGRIVSLLMLRRPRRLVILERLPGGGTARAAAVRSARAASIPA